MIENATPHRYGSLPLGNEFEFWKSRLSTWRSRDHIMLPGTLDGIQVTALPDTGSERNIVSDSFIRRRGHHISTVQNEGYIFTLADGGKVQSRGEIILRWNFHRESQTWDLLFHVLTGCTYDVIIGNLTLRETQTMSFHSHRLRKQNVLARCFFTINLIGCPQQRIQGALDGNAILAIPDTGSKRNIISAECAERLGLQVRTDDRARIWLKFPDGRSVQTSGQATASWSFGDQLSRPFYLHWDVLPGFPKDALIGSDVLYGRNVFRKYPHYFVEIWEEGKAFELFNVDEEKRKKRKKMSLEEASQRAQETHTRYLGTIQKVLGSGKHEKLEAKAEEHYGHVLDSIRQADTTHQNNEGKIDESPDHEKKRLQNDDCFDQKLKYIVGVKNARERAWEIYISHVGMIVKSSVSAEQENTRYEGMLGSIAIAEMTHFNNKEKIKIYQKKVEKKEEKKEDDRFANELDGILEKYRR
jgi:hypothetical protein